MSKKDNILAKGSDLSEYPLNSDEKSQLNALLELMDQAQKAQNIIFTSLVSSIAARYEISNARLDINLQEVVENNAEPKLIVVQD
jgi:hypothetical protein